MVAKMNPTRTAEPQEILLHEGGIRLGQFLKFISAVEDGIQAKQVISEGAVTVNGEPESRRGRQLSDGDVVTFGDEAWKLATEH